MCVLTLLSCVQSGMNVRAASTAVMKMPSVSTLWGATAAPANLATTATELSAQVRTHTHTDYTNIRSNIVVGQQYKIYYVSRPQRCVKVCARTEGPVCRWIPAPASWALLGGGVRQVQLGFTGRRCETGTAGLHWEEV